MPPSTTVLMHSYMSDTAGVVSIKCRRGEMSFFASLGSCCDKPRN
jgi:hypothetical protein